MIYILLIQHKECCMCNSTFLGGYMMDNSITVGLDAGNSNAKAAVWGRDKDGKRTIRCFKLPSHVNSEAPPLSLDGKSSSTEYYSFEHTDSKQPFTVKPNCHNAVNLFDKGQNSVEMAALVNAALMKAGLGGKNVLVATNLPLIHEKGFGYFSLNKATGRYDLNKKLMEAKCKNLIETKFKSLTPGIEMPIIKQALCFAELYAGAINQKCDNYGKIKKDNKKRGYFDLGGGTSQTGIITNLDLDSTTAKTLPVGSLSINDELYKILAKELDGFLDHTDQAKIRAQLSTHIQEGELYYRGEKVEKFKEFVDLAIERTVPHTIDVIIKMLKSNMHDLHQIVGFGGGINNYRKYTTDIKGLFVPEKPEFENVKGLLKIVTFMSALSENIDVDKVIELSEPVVEALSEVGEEIEIA